MIADQLRFRVETIKQKVSPADAWKGEEADERFAVSELVAMFTPPSAVDEQYAIHRSLCVCETKEDAERIRDDLLYAAKAKETAEDRIKNAKGSDPGNDPDYAGY